jgi:hypothetical protein
MSQESKKQTAVEWLAEKYNYLAWMRSNEDISASLAVEWLNNFFDQAKKMEKEQIMDAYIKGQSDCEMFTMQSEAEQYYNEVYGKQQNA